VICLLLFAAAVAVMAAKQRAASLVVHIYIVKHETAGCAPTTVSSVYDIN
jgi:alkylhydroperoxidase/carboxymuconolactone decarboxylase family protein YurZ